MRLAIAVLLAAACTTADGRPPAKARAAGAVVVELFTSEGCSSCPPADRLLNQLARDDRSVIALAYHVDYWDDLGWADPFASAAFTERQRAYAASAGRVYTPALVVNGGVDVVGSQRAAVTRAIAEATPLPGLPATATLDGDQLRVAATVAPGTTAVVAVYQDGLVTAVARGENAGETLHHDRVVRALVPIADRVAIALDPSWDRAHLGAVVLAAGPDRRLVAAQPLALTRAPARR